jgi:hypothetical protein
VAQLNEAILRSAQTTVHQKRHYRELAKAGKPDPVKPVAPVVTPQEKVDEKAVTSELLKISEQMSSNTFIAKINDRCRSCAVKSSCPIQPQGRGVIQS